ncbi:MAG: calcium/sodium antiporter [Bacteroidales bacterium]|nr:calcium/sodium antiporter [Bacteroidales bacterium]MBN2817489.1 calcium/sodium antiporter [Bacteroidales bacterium]
MEEYFYLLIGFVLLLFSGKYLVRGSVVIANHFKISKLVVGVTIVSLGTSAPEMFVSSIASYTGFPQIALGNVIGSNSANIALVLAITAIIIPIPVRKNSVKIDAPFMVIVSLLFYILLLDYRVSRVEGVLFLVLLVSYTLFIVYKSRREDKVEEIDEDKKTSIAIALLMVILSIAGLAFGSDLLVDNAAKIAEDFGVSQRVIAITLIAFGTSLPELTTSLIAALRKEMDISIGNIIGSNIFNILAVIGVSAIASPMDISAADASRIVTFDMYWMLGISVALFLFILPFKGGILTRFKGIVLFLIYCVYLYFLFRK